MVLRRRRRDKPLEILTERGSRQSLRAKEPQEYSHIDILETHPIGTAFPSKVNDGGVEVAADREQQAAEARMSQEKKSRPGGVVTRKTIRVP